MEGQTLDTLEVDALKALLFGLTQTPMGRVMLQELHPVPEREAIERALSLTTEARDLLGADGGLSLAGIEDPEPALGVLHVEGLSLSPVQILTLERLVATAMEARDLLQAPEARQAWPWLAELAIRIPNLRPLLTAVKGKILPDGGIDDNASPELRELRRQLQMARSRIHRHLESVMRKSVRAVQDELITFRNERFVIPVRTDSRNSIPGVVHGLSSSGQTTYVEPLSVIEQNNELVRLREQEEVEIARILLALTDQFRTRSEDVRTVAAILGELDLTQAKARLSDAFNCVPPHLSAGLSLRLRDARHILLEHNLRQTGGTIVPISLELDERNRALVISGPNAGGKTVVLKTVGMIAVMSQMGLHVPAAEAEIPVFDQIFADVGDQQSIAANLSTFTAHMRNVSEMARRVRPPALVLIDEVGTGTDPEEGASLAIAIVDHFLRKGATTIATTHYNQLKMWATRAAGVVNASVEFDASTLRPTYRLAWGIAGASSGLQIAERIGVPADIVSVSRSMLDPRHLEANDYLIQLRQRTDEVVRLRAELTLEREELERTRSRLAEDHAIEEQRRNREFETALDAALQEYRAESDRMIGDLRDRAAAERLRKAASEQAAALRRKGFRLAQRAGVASSGNAGRVPTSAASSRDPEAGDRVRITSLDKQGVVESVHDGHFAVVVGPLRFRARKEELELVARAAAAAPVPPTHARPAPGMSIDEEPAREINIIGLNADEAVERVDKFLDAAFLAGVETVRIIHGHGKGVLRRAVADLLAGHCQVESFAPAPPNQGGGGATVAQLKKD